MSRSNCLLWALALYRRRRGRIRYVVARRSHWGWFPHFFYAEARPDGRLRLVAYAPTEPRARLLPPLLFRGAVRWGDR